MKNILFIIVCLLMQTIGNSQTLAEKLGYKNTDRLLIINCDDVGMCEAANQAVIEGQTKGIITSGTVMVPCPKSGDIIQEAKNNPSLNLGIHLTHTAEWKDYRWGSVTDPQKVKGLYDNEGYLWRSVEEVYANATPEEAYVEGKAQIQKAIDAGLVITHIDSHMGTMQLLPPYVDKYLQLASEFNFPVRMASQETLAKFGQPDMRKKFSDKGIIFADYMVYEELERYTEDDIIPFWTEIIKNLKPGVSELYIHGSVPNEELKTITDSWPTRNAEYDLFTNNKKFIEFVKKEGIILISYKPLFELQRKLNN